jgi:hypothetical protein
VRGIPPVSGRIPLTITGCRESGLGHQQWGSEGGGEAGSGGEVGLDGSDGR